MRGPHLTFPLTQREWHEQAAAIAFQAPPPPTITAAGMPVAASPFTPNPLLIQDE